MRGGSGSKASPILLKLTTMAEADVAVKEEPVEAVDLESRYEYSILVDNPTF